MSRAREGARRRSPSSSSRCWKQRRGSHHRLQRLRRCLLGALRTRARGQSGGGDGRGASDGARASRRGSGATGPSGPPARGPPTASAVAWAARQQLDCWATEPSAFFWWALDEASSPRAVWLCGRSHPKEVWFLPNGWGRFWARESPPGGGGWAARPRRAGTREVRNPHLPRLPHVLLFSLGLEQVGITREGVQGPSSLLGQGPRGQRRFCSLLRREVLEAVSSQPRAEVLSAALLLCA